MVEPTPHQQPNSKRRPEPVIIKKYANRRLYNTDSSTYVTLESLAEMVRDNIEFMVVDAKTGDDLTRPVLTQIIVEQEAKGTNLLPIPFLRQLISMYGDNMQWFVPNYLEKTMQHFTDNQERLQDYLQQTFGQISQTMPNTTMPAMFPFGQMQQPTSVNQPMQALQAVSKQMVEQQKVIFEQAQNYMMKMFTPFAATTAAAPTNSTSEKAETLNALKQKVAALEAELKGMGH